MDSAFCVLPRVDAASGRIETVLGCGIEAFSSRRDAGAGGPPRLSAGSGGQPRRGTILRLGYDELPGARRRGRWRPAHDAGWADGGDAGDGGPATRARLNHPCGLRLYGEGLLLICDHWNNRLRRPSG